MSQLLEEPDDEDKMPPPGYVPGHRITMGAGLSPHAPGQQTIVPGAIAPSFAAPVLPPEGGKLEVQGLCAGRCSRGLRQTPECYLGPVRQDLAWRSTG